MRRCVLVAVFTTVTVVLYFTLYIYTGNRAEKLAHFAQNYQNYTFVNKATCRPFSERENYTDLGFSESEEFNKTLVPLYEHLNWTQTNSPQRNNGCTPCTNSLFKEYVRNTHQLPFNGTWLRYVSKSSESFRFHPNFCSFSEEELTNDYIRRCLEKKNIKKLVTIGDSNSERLIEGFARIFGQVFDRCDLVGVEQTREKPESDPHYFLGNITFNSSDVSFLGQRCGVCTKRFICSNNVNNKTDNETKIRRDTLELEQIANTRIIDGSRRILAKIEQILPTNYSQVFLFRDYFRIKRYPDVILFQTPFTHETFYGAAQVLGSFEGLREPLRKLQKWMKEYIPPTIPVYWVTNVKRLEINDDVVMKNRLLRELLEMFSEEMLSVLGSKDNNFWPFFELYKLSAPLRTLHQPADPGHLKPPFYDLIAKYFLLVHCNS